MLLKLRVININKYEELRNYEVFFLRNYLHLQINAIPTGAFMGIGITLKIIFIVLFIKKSKAQRSQMNEQVVA